MFTLKQKLHALLACLVVLSTGSAYTQVKALSFQELQGSVLGVASAEPVQMTSVGNRNLKVTATAVSFDGTSWTYRFDWQRTAKRQGSLYVNQKAVAASADPSGSATVVLPPSSRARVEFYGSPNGKGSLLLRKYLTTQAAVSQPTTNLTAETAKVAAQSSDVCTAQGAIGDFEGYNSSSQTWWFTLPADADHEGCNPACVVNDQTKEADINWRCTGLTLPPVTPPATCNYFAAPSCPDGSTPVWSDPTSCNYTCPTKTCQPRPACLDGNPRCMIAEPAGGWCPTKKCTPRPVCINDPVTGLRTECNYPEPAGGWCPVTRPPSSTVSITKLDPASGPVGTRVTITGTGFTEAAITASIPGNITSSNTVQFNGMTIGQYYSMEGKTLTFTVPSSLAPNCSQGQICPTSAMVVTPGDYKVTVSNANGISNSVTFTVTSGETRACTMEAKLCPDNKTYVSRDPNKNCEFKPCPTIAMCDYAAPPQGCTYVQGPDYNATTRCGMILSCPARNVTITTTDSLNVTKGTAGTITFYASAASIGAFSPLNQYKFTETGSVPGMSFTSCPPCNAGPGMMCSMVCSANSVALTGTPTTAGSYPITITATDSSGNSGSQSFTVVVGAGSSTCTYPIPMPLCPNNGTPVFNSNTCSYTCPIVDCPLYWYLDNTSTSCQQKRFCGSYMYLGLETFMSQDQCNTALQNRKKPVSIQITTPSSLSLTQKVASNISFYATAMSSLNYMPMAAYKFTGSGSVPGMSFEGCLPSGCSSNSYFLTGTPTTAGTYPITVTATDQSGNTGSQSFTITVNGVTTPTCPDVMPYCPNGYTQTTDRNGCIIRVCNQQPALPAITSITPSSGSVGTPISILGTGFDATGNYVNFGGYGIQNMASQSMASSIDGRTINISVPPVNPGTVQVYISNTHGQSQPASFTVTTAPTVCSTEARLCPDNRTYVSRTGPSCEFAPCPPIIPICPNYTPPAPNWCSGGSIVSQGTDPNGCQLPPKCVFPQVPQCPNYTPPAPDWCATGNIVSQGLGPDGCQLPPKCVYPEVPPTCNFYVAPTCPNGGKPVFKSGTCDYSCPTTPTPTCQYTTGLYCPNNSYNYDNNGCISGCRPVASY